MNTPRNIAILLASAAGLASAAPSQAPGATIRVSVDSFGHEATAFSAEASISADGRYVAFASFADDLVPGDTNGVMDVFVHDLATGATTRVSVDSNGNQALGGDSRRPSITPDGRFVAFTSSASNLVPGDTNGVRDVFVHDRLLGTTTRVSVGSNGAEAKLECGTCDISADGRFVVFDCRDDGLTPGDTNGTWDVFLHDRATGTTSRITQGTQAPPGILPASLAPVVSDDGRFVAFESLAEDLVPGDTNGHRDVFVHDRLTGTIEGITVDAVGGGVIRSESGEAALSADGRYVAFSSWADDLVPGDTNLVPDVFVHDRTTGVVTRVSVASSGAEAHGTGAHAPSLSADGRFVSFVSDADDLVAGDTNQRADVFVHDRATGETVRVDLTPTGIEANGSVLWDAVLSADGSHVAFTSEATNLVSGDTNAVSDVFVVRPEPLGLFRTAGSCPGPVTWTATESTPLAPVAFVLGTPGRWLLPPGTPCAGTALDLVPWPPAGPFAALVTVADAAGRASVTTWVPSGACGVGLVQALDPSTCATSTTRAP